MRIIPRKDATGDALEVQYAFAAALARRDPKSAEREAHYAWLDRNGFARHHDVRRVGWYGQVESCDPRPGGGWLVKISVIPQLSSRFRIGYPFLSDTVEETYEFVEGRVRMVDSNAATPRPDRQHFPIAF